MKLRGAMKKPLIIIPVALLLITAVITAYPRETRIMGIIDTVREDGFVTVVSPEPLTLQEYLILNSDGRPIGRIINPEPVPGKGPQLRYIARFNSDGKGEGSLLRAGVNIIITVVDKPIEESYIPDRFNEKRIYRESIISPVDGRIMVLVPEGEFLFGCDHGERDEYPEHAEFLPDYYIDRYEVSNNDYRAYADASGLKYPPYWKGHITGKGLFTEPYFAALPVIVSYREAAAYARWARKRLPEEKEWEKAARLPIAMDKAGQASVYSWGNEFRQDIANTMEFWLDEKTGINLKLSVRQKYGLTELHRGYLPVDSYEEAAVTYYGCVNMDGNAPEWTASWYRAYTGNRVPDKRFGTLYRVIRGGAYFTSSREARLTDRKTGGLPDPGSDCIAGFRCVKKAEACDRK